MPYRNKYLQPVSSSPGVNFILSLRHASALVDRYAERTLLDIGITPERLIALWVIKSAVVDNKKANPMLVSDMMASEPQTVAGLLNRMEKEGLITRDRKRKGQNYTALSLTKAGEKKLSDGIDCIIMLLSEFAEHFELSAPLFTVADTAAEAMHLRATPVRVKLWRSPK